MSFSLILLHPATAVRLKINFSALARLTKVVAMAVVMVVVMVVVATLLSACSESEQDKKARSDAFLMWLDTKYEEELQFSPIGLTFLGRKDKYQEIDSFTYESFKKQLQWKLQTVVEMEKLFAYDKLSNDEQLSYDLWKYQVQNMEKDAKFFFNGLVFDQMNGMQSFLPTFLINFHKVDTVADMDAYIARIEVVRERVEEIVDNAEKASKIGVITPAFALKGVIMQAQAVIEGAPFSGQDDTEDSDIWADIRSEIDNLEEQQLLNPEQAEKLLNKASKALLTAMQPAYKAIITWAKKEQEEQAKTFMVSTGIGNQPSGADYYKHCLATHTTTDLTADEIHQIGLDEIARLRKEMEEVMRSTGFNGNLEKFFNYIRAGKWNYYPNTDAGRESYIDDATAAIDNIKSNLPNYFGLLPKADLIVKRVEAFREQDGAAQHYYPGTPDGSRAGIYYAHLSDMNTMPKNQLEVIAYHEGLPGHHMQISIAQELQGVPQFRTQAEFTAYTEGWALYSEKLAKEIEGTYKNPYQDFGRLTAEIWRAIRLVVDTGLHDQGWTEQRAIDFFLQNSPEPLASVRSEIQRYIVLPGQATSYKIGMLKILELRKRAELALGSDFDIRKFHDTILGGGALPLRLLERKVDAWIKASKI